MPVEHPFATPTTLAEASRAEMLSTLAAGTLHDVSHLLVLALGCAELVLDDPALGERSRHLVEDVIRAGERAEVLARQMLAFARGDVDAPAGMIDMVAALRAAEPLVRRVAGPAATVTVEARGTPLWVRATAVDVDRLIVNLVANSRDAGAAHRPRDRPRHRLRGTRAARRAVCDDAAGRRRPRARAARGPRRRRPAGRNRARHAVAGGHDRRRRPAGRHHAGGAVTWDWWAPGPWPGPVRQRSSRPRALRGGANTFCTPGRRPS